MLTQEIGEKTINIFKIKLNYAQFYMINEFINSLHNIDRKQK